MAIRTDYRVTDDAEEFADIALFLNKTDEGEDVIVLNQDGSEITIPLRMISDIKAAVDKLIK